MGGVQLSSSIGKEVTMRVSIYRVGDGRLDVMVEASPGNGKAPVVLQHITREDFVSRVSPVIDAQRGRRDTAQPPTIT